MHEAIPRPLQAWENFYVIVGSSAGALTGLQFVVLTLIAEVWSPTGALFAIGASALMLVFIGIHNAWDTVMYVTTQLPSASSSGASAGSSGGAAAPTAATTAGGDAPARRPRPPRH